jgi:hypothetical protein
VPRTQWREEQAQALRDHSDAIWRPARRFRPESDGDGPAAAYEQPKTEELVEIERACNAQAQRDRKSAAMMDRPITRNQRNDSAGRVSRIAGRIPEDRRAPRANPIARTALTDVVAATSCANPAAKPGVGPSESTSSMSRLPQSPTPMSCSAALSK